MAHTIRAVIRLVSLLLERPMSALGRMRTLGQRPEWVESGHWSPSGSEGLTAASLCNGVEEKRGVELARRRRGPSLTRLARTSVLETYHTMVLLVTLAFIAIISPAPTPADVAALAKFVADDRSYAAMARAEAEKRLDLLPAVLGDPAAFELEAAGIVALADNGHTVYFPPQWTMRYSRSNVRFGLFADGLFVISAPTAKAPLLGRRVAKINGHSWREVRQAYSRYQGGSESFKDQFFAYFAETPALLKAAGYSRDGHRLRIGFDNGEETLATASSAPLSGEEAMLGVPHLRAAAPLIKGKTPLYLQASHQLYAFAELPEIDAAYIRLDAIGGQGLEAFLSDTLARLRAGRQHNIVVDLRMNMGGDLNRAREFAKALPALARGGRLYAITSGRTFSAAISTLGYLRQAGPGKITIVGEPIGDRLEFFAEGGVRELPDLGARLLLATERHNYRKGCSESDCHAAIRDNPIAVEGLLPDIAAPMRFADYVAGRDPALEAISLDIAQRRNAGEPH